VSLPYRPNRDGLHLLVDNTGVKMLGEGEGEGEGKTKKHVAEYGVEPTAGSGARRI